jgi:hypothetical protein
MAATGVLPCGAAPRCCRTAPPARARCAAFAAAPPAAHAHAPPPRRHAFAPQRRRAAPLAARAALAPLPHALHATAPLGAPGRQRQRQRNNRNRTVTTPIVATALPSWPPAPVWSDFAAAHAGVWEGASARYSPEGLLLEVPAKYIPEAYKEWGQTLHEWPCRATAAPDAAAGRMRSELERFWPTVGCEYGKVRPSFVPIMRECALMRACVCALLCVG